MVLALPLLLGLLAGDQAEADRVALEKAEWAAYEECVDARRPTKVWKVDVEDAWLRAGEAPEAPTQGVLHRGETVKLLKRAASGNLFVKTGEDRKGYLRSDEVVEVIIPPWDTRPIEDCPQPGFLREFHPRTNILDPPVTGPGPGPADPENPAAEGTPP